MNKRILSFLLAWTLVFTGLMPAAYAGQALAEPIASAAVTAADSATADTAPQTAPEVSESGAAAPTVTSEVYQASMTEARTLELMVTLPDGASTSDIVWNFGRTAEEMKPIAEWKKWNNASSVRAYTGDPFIKVQYETVTGSTYKADITFDILYGSNLSVTGIRAEYVKRVGVYDLIGSVPGGVLASQKVKLNAYDDYHTYDEIKPAIDRITADSNNKYGRYVEYQKIGESTQGRDIHFSIVAKDKASVDQYLNETLPLMMNDPAALQEKIKNGQLTDYKVPIWLNNIHADEANGVDAIIKFLDTLMTQKFVTYDTTDANGIVVPVTLDIDAALDHVIFLLDYVENPDGRALNTRATSTLLDPNRDNSYQTQPETQAVTAQIAKWTPLSFLDLHGFVSGFLIEPCTPPHDPNIEYDLVLNSMLAQANAIGNAGIANTKYNSYTIPYEETEKLRQDPNYQSPPGTYATGWDDASPAYTAVFAMHQGALGHTIEVPELNEEGLNAFYYGALGATSYVMNHKDELFLNQLEVFKRGIANEDNSAVDQYLINGNYEVIGRPRAGNANFFPEYYVLPVDKSLQKNQLEVYKMVQYLLRNNVKVERTTSPITVNSVTYPAGTYVVNMHQAKRGYANLVLYDGLNVSDFEEMYSDTVQNFADMRGFDRYVLRTTGAFAGATEPVSGVTIPVTDLNAVPFEQNYVIRNSNNDAIKAVNELIRNKKAVILLDNGGSGYEKGSFLVSRSNLRTVASKYLLDIVPFSTSSDKSGKLLKAPSVAIGGAVSYMLADLGFNVTSDTAAADVLVNSGTNLIASGKPFIGYGRSMLNTVKGLNVLPGLNYSNPVNSAGRTDAHEGLFKADISQNSVITAPYADSEYLYTVSAAFITSVPEGAEILAKYGTGDDFFKAGWWPNSDAAKGQVLALNYQQGGVHVTLFANDLMNKYHPQNQFRLLANAIYAAAPAATEADGMDNGPLEPAPESGTSPGTGSGSAATPSPSATATPSPSATATPAPSASPVPSSTPVASFTDLGNFDWAAPAIQELTAKGILKGVSATSFAPKKEVTRAEFITMIVRAFGLLDEAASASFTDVKTTDWSYGYIASGVKNGLVNGVGGGKFDPKRAVTREEMAIIAANALKQFKGKTVLNPDQALSGFTDKDSIAAYAKEAVALLAQEGVVNGLTPDTFGPKGISNRAQAAVIISRLINLK
ncbi:S-layer homology domain-containing protein [Paenibacillus sp. HN-1]|uniref:S-layer homology domain-containing protein n=1 Tax=Paenibacillus TaxID=44249 RepID=UPI001CA7D72D|nr:MULTISPECIES: S-layer homology domain-containing protein [Paenibacillus]MBY9078919.1 S-layer homology domain-containing protein [Paenibacillus sp. CGMCC 1.18879]MBY9087632.1 S-layer homology domain-containing protein [Paenibacillus sinensis]